MIEFLLLILLYLVYLQSTYPQLNYYENERVLLEKKLKREKAERQLYETLDSSPVSQTWSESGFNDQTELNRWFNYVAILSYRFTQINPIVKGVYFSIAILVTLYSAMQSQNKVLGILFPITSLALSWRQKLQTNDTSAIRKFGITKFSETGYV